MSRRKGEITSAEIDRDWPHQVALPAEFVTKNYHEIAAFAETLSVASRGHSVVDGSDWYDVYCFASAADADTFRRQFDGIPFDPKDHGRGVNWMMWRRPGAPPN